MDVALARVRPDRPKSNTRFARVLCGHPSQNCGAPLAELVSGAPGDGHIAVVLRAGFVEKPAGSGHWELGHFARRQDAFARRTDPRYNPHDPVYATRRPQRLVFPHARVLRSTRGALVVDDGGREGREGLVPLRDVDVSSFSSHTGARVSGSVAFSLEEALASRLCVTCPVKGCGQQSAVWAGLLHDCARFAPLEEALRKLRLPQAVYEVIGAVFYEVVIMRSSTPVTLHPLQKVVLEFLRARAQVAS